MLMFSLRMWVNGACNRFFSGFVWLSVFMVFFESLFKEDLFNRSRLEKANTCLIEKPEILIIIFVFMMWITLYYVNIHFNWIAGPFSGETCCKALHVQTVFPIWAYSFLWLFNLHSVLSNILHFIFLVRTHTYHHPPPPALHTHTHSRAHTHSRITYTHIVTILTDAM